MGLFDKAKFWKKEEFSTDFGKETPSYDLGAPQNNQDPMQTNTAMQGMSLGTEQHNDDPFANQYSQATQPQQNYPQASPFPGGLQSAQQEHDRAASEGIHPRDVELILAKLDAIKSELDALHQRVRKIEQVSDAQTSTAQKKYW